jgi:tetratricopeptide (TPR) repeat protein
MKALEKDRNRRYDSPGAFAEDVERYLRREVILARPPSTAYRLRKFVQRNRAAVLAAAVVAVVLLGGSATAVWQAVRATQAKEQALTALAAEREAREWALTEEAKTRAVLEFVEDHILTAARPKGHPGGQGPDVTLAGAVESALPFVERIFAKQPLVEARLRLTLGASFAYRGDNRTAARQFEAARALFARHCGPDHPDTLRSMNDLASSYRALGRLADAHRLHEQTLSLLKAKLGPNHPNTLTSMNNLANSYAALGRQADALQLRQETLALRRAKLGPDHPHTLTSMHNLATSYAELGRHADAVRLYKQTLSLMKVKLGPDHPTTLTSMNDLANSYADFGRPADAIALYQEVLSRRKTLLGPNHPHTLVSMHNLATCYADLGRHADAIRLYEETLTLRKEKLGPDHPDTLTTMNNLANSHAALGRHADAFGLHQQTLTLMKAKLGPNHPNTLFSMANVAQSLIHLNRGAEAVLILDDCVRRAAGKIVDPRLLPTVMDRRLRYFQKRNDPTGCRQTAERWEKLNRSDAGSLYVAARMRAVTAAVFRAADTSPAGTEQADAEADRAMDWLRRAVAAGYKNAARVQQDRDLAALRGRADFAKLVTMLSACEKKGRQNPH